MSTRRRAAVSSAAGAAGLFAVFTGLWYLLSCVLLPPHKRFLLPPPHRVLTGGFLTWHTGERRGLQPMLMSLWDTSRIALGGLAISVVVGTAIAVTMGSRRWLEKAAWPYLVAVQSAPVLALTPLIRALIDDATAQRLLVVVLVCVFPIVSNTLFGLHSVDPGLRDIFVLHGADRITTMRKLGIPSALPSFFVGLRSAAGLSVIGAVVGDFYFRRAGTVGIGAQIDVYRSRLWGEELIAAIILASLLGIAVFLAFEGLSRRVLGHRHTARTSR